jgi:hypothetical protein
LRVRAAFFPAATLFALFRFFAAMGFFPFFFDAFRRRGFPGL